MYPNEELLKIIEEMERISRDPYLAYQQERIMLDFFKQQDALASLPDSLPVPSHLAAAVNERDGVLDAARERLESLIGSAYAVGVSFASSLSDEALSRPSLAEDLKKIVSDLERHLSPENLDSREVAFAQGIYDGLKERMPEFFHDNPVPDELSQQINRISAVVVQGQQSLPTFEREALVAGIEKAREGLQIAPSRSQDVEIG